MDERGPITRSDTGHGARRDPSRGAAFVEFALVLPLLLLFLLGIVTAGIAYNRKLDITHATREGARYGATVPPSQDWVSGSWASNVRDLVVSRSAGELDNASVCVALVVSTSPDTAQVYSDADNGPSFYTTKGDGTPCFGDTYSQFGPTDDGLRVQVAASVPARIELGILPAINVTLSSNATARVEVFR